MKQTSPKQYTRLLATTALLALACAVLGQTKAMLRLNDRVLQQKDSTFFLTEEARRVGDQLLLYQRDTGGWPKNVDMTAPLSAVQCDSVAWQKSRIDDSTIDNKATTMQMTYLANLFQHTRDQRYREGFVRAMDFLLNAQYDNGGWPQFWPKMRDYQIHITYNDNAMVNVLKLLRDVCRSRYPYDGSLVDDTLRRRAVKAFDNGIACIIATQIVVDGQPTVWCQQHDRETLLPAKARAYELPSYCSQESAEIVLLLMQLPSPDERVVKAVNGAMLWLDRHKLAGLRIEHFTTDGKNDIRVVEDPAAPPLWARYYDLEQALPFFCDRDGQPKRSLSEIGRERRSGYGWYTTVPAQLYDRYEKWVEKNKLNSVLVRQ